MGNNSWEEWKWNQESDNNPQIVSLIYYAKGHWFESRQRQQNWKTLYVNPVVNGYLFLKSGKDRAAKGDRWDPPLTCCAPTASLATRQ